MCVCTCACEYYVYGVCAFVSVCVLRACVLYLRHISLLRAHTILTVHCTDALPAHHPLAARPHSVCSHTYTRKHTHHSHTTHLLSTFYQHQFSLSIPLSHNLIHPQTSTFLLSNTHLFSPAPYNTDTSAASSSFSLCSSDFLVGSTGSVRACALCVRGTRSTRNSSDAPKNTR